MSEDPGMRRVASGLLFLLALGALALARSARADADSIVLVARPELVAPGFRQTVVVVTHTPRGETLGVVLNRPTPLRLAEVAPEFPGAAHYAGRLFAGGPVLPRVVVALFRAAAPPAAPAFRVLDGGYLTMHPDNIAALLARTDGEYRLFAGFCGWAPGQLEAEIAREDWYVLPSSAEVLFRRDTSGLWRELVERARSRRTIYFTR